MKHSVRYLVVLLIAVSVSAGMGQLFAGKPGGGGGCPTPRPNCVCEAVYAPVICDGACTYSNQCVADCAKATHCVPGDIGPQPVNP